MGSRKALRVSTWIVGILVVLVIAGYVTLRVMLPPEKLRALVLPRIEEALGQSVEVGPVHLAIWGGFGISVEDLRIGNRPGFGDEKMLKLQKLVLRIPLRPLLHRQLEIEKIDLARPEVFIEKSADGNLNIEGLGQRLSPAAEGQARAEAKPSKPAGPIGLPIPITLESLSIEDGRVSFRDAAGFRADVRGLDLKSSLSVDRSLKDTRTQGRLSAREVALGIPGMKKPLPPLPLDIAYRARVDLTSSVLSLDEVNVTVMDALVRTTGTVEDFVHPVLHLQTETSTDLSTIPLGEDIRLSGKLSSSIRTEGPALRPDSLNLVGTVTLDHGALETPELPVPLKDLAAQIVLKGQDVEIPNLSGSLGSSSFRVNASVVDAVPFAATGGKVVPVVRFDVRSPLLAADEWLPEPAPGGRAPAKAQAAPKKIAIPPIPEVSATGTVLVEKITAKKLEATNLRAAVELAKNRLMIPEFGVALYTGKVLGSAGADFTRLPDLPVTVSVTAEAIEANDFISVLTSFNDHLYGKLDLTGEFEWSGTSPEEVRRTLAGRGNATVSQGRLVNWEFARELSKWIQFLNFENLDFKDMNLDYEVANERFSMHPLRLKALDTSWKVDGSAGFDESLDYRVVATLSAAATQSLRDRLPLPRSLTASVKQAELVFFVSGSAKSPKFRWDSASVRDQAEDQARKQVQDLIEGKKGEAADALLKEVDKRVGGEAKDVVKDVLGGFLKPDSTDTTGSQQKIEDLKKEGEKALKDLLGKKKKP